MEHPASIEELLALDQDNDNWREEVKLSKEFAEAYESLYNTLNNTCQNMYGLSLHKIGTQQYEQ